MCFGPGRRLRYHSSVFAGVLVDEGAFDRGCAGIWNLKNAAIAMAVAPCRATGQRLRRSATRRAKCAPFDSTARRSRPIRQRLVREINLEQDYAPTNAGKN